jgi:TP901 family phage tail tape measure protein
MTSFADPPSGGMGGDSTRTATVNLQANIAGYSQPMAQAQAQTSGLARGVDELSSRMHAMSKWAGRKMFQFAASDFAVLSGASADAALFQKQLGTLSATAVVTGTSMRGVKGGIESSFTNFPVARSQVIALTESISGLGVTATRDLASYSSTFIKLGAATGEGSAGLAGGLISLSRAMGTTDAHQVGNFANSLLTVSKGAGVSATGVLNFANTIAPFAKQAGIGEASVLGISTAFNKVGADGFVATNTLNTILSDINTSVATGGPDLLKYSNLLGVTTTQFAKMDKTKAVVDIFKELTKMGPQATQVLDSLGLPGIRSQAAIAAVLQGGHMEQSIAVAEGAQGNQKNLTKGSAAAFNNLGDNLSKVRNQFTQFGTEIGTTFLAPMSAVASVTASVGHHLNDLIRPLAPILAGLGVVAGATAGAGGIAVNMAGMIGAYALISTLRKSTPVTRFKEGFADARTGTARFSPAEVAAMPFRQRAGLYLGGGTGGMFGSSAPLVPGQVGSLRELQTWRNLGIGGAFRVPGMLLRQTTQFLDQSRLTARERLTHDWSEGRAPVGQAWRQFRTDVAGKTPTQVVGQELPRLAGMQGAQVGAQVRVGGAAMTAALKSGWELIGPRTVTGMLAGLLTGMPMGAGRPFNAFANQQGAPTVKQTALGVGRSFTQFGQGLVTTGPVTALASLDKAIMTSVLALGKFGTTVGRVALLETGRAGAWGVGKVASGVGQVAGAAWTLGGGLLKAALSPVGMAAMFAGVEVDKRWRKGQQAGNLDQFLNPIQKYNDMLGTTTSNLATFNTALVTGSASLAAATPLDQPETVTASNLANAPSKPKVGAWTTAAGSKDKIAAGAAMLGTLPMSDPRQRDAARQDLLATGKYTVAEAQQVFDLYDKRGGRDATSGLGSNIDYRVLGQRIGETEGKGTNIGGWLQNAVMGFNENTYGNKSKSGAKLLGSAMSGVESQRVSDEAIGGVYAKQAALASYSKLFAPMIQIAGGSNTDGSHQAASTRDALAHAASKITGGGYGGYLATLTNQTHGVKLSDNMTEEQQQAAFVKLLQSTKQGRKWLGTITDGGGTLDPKKFAAKIVDLQNTADGSDFNTILRTKGGDIGKFAAGSADVQKAIGSGSQNFVSTQTSSNLLQGAAMFGAKGNTSQGIADLQTMMTKIDPSSPLYKQLTAAQQQIQVKQQEAAPYQSRAENFKMVGQNYVDAQAGYDKSMREGTATQGQYDFLQQQKATFEQSKSAQNDYFKQIYTTARDYGISRTRAAEDEQTSEAHSARDFHTSMIHASEDYQIQLSRSAADFAKQRRRSQEDYNTELVNQAATAAKSIYDPWRRVQATYTSDASTVLANLQDQNKRIADQRVQTEKLSRMGLSTQAIQTLDLANPTNAQQTNEMLGSLTANPALIAQINAQVKTRVAGTASLTQNAFNLSFVQGQKANTLGLKRADEDYAKQASINEANFKLATKRAVAAQAVALDDMRRAYTRVTKRAGEDLQTAMTELTGTFSKNYTKAMSAVATAVQKWSPAAAAVMRGDLTKLSAEFPGLGLAAAAGPTDDFPAGRNAAAGPVDDFPKGRGAAAGSIFRSRAGGHLVHVGEANHDETVLPLNSDGQAWMAGMIVKALAQALSISGGGGVSTSTATHVDASTTFSGPVSVQANDAEALGRQLAAKAKLDRLTSPVRH